MSPWWIKPREAAPSISPRKLLALSIAFALIIALNLLAAIWKFSHGDWSGALYLTFAFGLGLWVVVTILAMRKRKHAP